jgi:hypothetical protein
VVIDPLTLSHSKLPSHSSGPQTQQGVPAAELFVQRCQEARVDGGHSFIATRSARYDASLASVSTRASPTARSDPHRTQGCISPAMAFTILKVSKRTILRDVPRSARAWGHGLEAAVPSRP